ncbi:hypothetical protein OOK06_36845 [Streptomyces sp. NBC_00340]|uniref:hypothetical protein n=1 Tax=Streptomyces sp. NBC_00340 TaxID=2975716 RepID=UPI00224F607B|nr:hypothetical protein [Streptomyces sp. NBC_00340]MCX5137640.1 hypothetical protein [Streptomyces sp. NBC_00340]
MSMYNLVAADGHQYARGTVLLAALDSPNVGRFRDAWVEKGEDGEPVIAIYTRNGGGNRECWCDEHPEDGCLAATIEALEGHPLYLRDADDDFDSTYATFYFRTPAPLVEQFREIAGEPVDMSEAWRKAIAALSGTGEAS